MKLLIPATCIAAALGAAPTPGRAGPRVIHAPALEEAPRRCPEVLRGVDLAFRGIPGGVALELTSARPAQVAELREQLREVALAVEQYSRAPFQVLEATAAGVEPVRIPPLEISVNDTWAGARVLIRTQRARDLPELVDMARTLQQIWSRSDCSDEVFVQRRARLSQQA